jgi:hypothetical protein
LISEGGMGREEGKEEEEKERKEKESESEGERGRVKTGDRFGCGWRSQPVTAVCRSIYLVQPSLCRYFYLTWRLFLFRG